MGHKNGNFRTGYWTQEATRERAALRAFLRACRLAAKDC
jgi:hypothetical protein